MKKAIANMFYNRRSIQVLFVLTFLFFVLGCKEMDPWLFGEYNIEYVKDDFDGYEKYFMTTNPLFSEEPDLNGAIGTLNFSGMHFLLQKFITEENSYYSLILEYYSHKWLFISEKTHLKIILEKEDGKSKIISLKPFSRRQTEVLSGGSITERILYHITLAEIKKISTGISAKVKVSGHDGHDISYFCYLNFEYIKRFLKEPFIDKLEKD